MVLKRFYLLALCAILSVVFSCRAAPSAPSSGPRIVPEGSATPVLTDSARRALGIQNGPDGLAASANAGGQPFTIFSGSNSRGQHGTFRFLGTPLGTLTAAGQSVPEPVLRAGKEDPIPPDRGGQFDASGRDNGFDRDYAGGGSLLELDGTIYYFYHGENRYLFEPGQERRYGGLEGWSGLGLAVWDPGTSSFRKIGQIIGLNAPNGVDAQGNHPEANRQNAPLSDQASAAYNEADGNIYLFFSDAAGESQGRARAHVTVARAPKKELVEAVQAGRVPVFKKYHQGQFSQPGVIAMGMGGASSSILERQGLRNAHVLWLPQRKRFLMITNEGHETLAARLSPDGLKWGAPTTVARAAPGKSVLYPALHVGDKSESQFWVVYTQVSKGTNARTGRKQLLWKEGASLEKQRFKIEWGS